MLEQLILIIHVLAALLILGLILLQQGKGADAGASFGSGGSQTVLGVQGGGNMLTRMTAVLVTVFFATSLTLGYYAKQQSVAVDVDIPAVEEVFDTPVADEIPAIEESSSSEEIPEDNDVPVTASSVDIPEDDVPVIDSVDEIPE